MEGLQNNKFYSQGTENKTENIENKFIRNLNSLINLDVDKYLTQLNKLLINDENILFDANLYQIGPSRYIGYLVKNNFPDDSFEKLFNKATDYTLKIKNLIENKEIYSTEGIIEEILYLSQFHKTLLDRYEPLFFGLKRKRAFNIIKENLREIRSIENSIINELYERLKKKNDFNKEKYNRIRNGLYEIFNNTEASINDKDLVCRMIFESINKKTLVVSRDHDIEELINDLLFNHHFVKNLSKRNSFFLRMEILREQIYTITASNFFIK